MSRRKQTALADVPQTRAEATALVAEYVASERRALDQRLGYELQIDKSKTERDAVLAMIAADQAPRFAALKAWWEAGGKDLAGKKRSAELAGASLGVRLTTPAVKFARGVTAKSIIYWLGQVVGGAGYLRTKVELDKQAIIKAIGEDGVGFRFTNVLTVVQTDEFFIDCGLDEAALRTQFSAETPKE